MAITPFIEAPFVRTINMVTNAIATSAIDTAGWVADGRPSTELIINVPSAAGGLGGPVSIVIDDADTSGISGAGLNTIGIGGSGASDGDFANFLIDAIHGVVSANITYATSGRGGPDTWASGLTATLAGSSTAVTLTSDSTAMAGADVTITYDSGFDVVLKAHLNDGIVEQQASDMFSVNGDNMDPLRQGVSIRTKRQLYSGMMPKFFPDYQRTPNGEQESTNYGQPTTFNPTLPYVDMQKFNPVTFVSGSDNPIMYPLVSNVSLLNPNQMDGVIEPLTIRKVVSMMSTDGSQDRHRIRGSIQAGDVDARNKSSQLVQVYDYREPLVTVPFIDAPLYMGDATDGSVILPGIISDAEAILRPFRDASHEERVLDDVPAIDEDGLMLAALLLMTGSSSQSMLGENQISATAGFIYDNAPLGTDSLAFGGLKK